MFTDALKSPSINNNSLAPKLEYIDENFFVKFGGSCLVKLDGSCLVKENGLASNEKILNIYIAYDLDSSLNNFDPTLQNSLFGVSKITKSGDIDEYQYSGYGIGFDSEGTFTHPTGSFGQNAIIFGADMSSSTHATNRANNIFVLGKYFIQGITNTTIYAEKMYSINFSATGRRFCLTLYYNGDNSYLFVDGREMIKFKTKDSEIVANSLCLGNISNDSSESNRKKTGLYGSIYDFSINHKAIALNDILDIHKYLTKKHNIV